MRPTRVLILLVAAAPLLAAETSSAQSRRGRDRDGPERSTPSTQPVAPAAGAGSTRPGAMEDQFSVLLERSIFARSGIATRADRPPATTTAPAAPVLSPEQAVVFVGVLAQDDEYVAFAENQVTRQLMVLRTGDDVASGKVVGITLDTLAYGSGGSIRVVHLGENLAGETGSTSFASGASPTTGPSSTGATSPSTAGMTPEQQKVAEMLRARRRAQGGN